MLQWLQSQNLIPLLLGYLSEQYSPATQTSAGDFIKAIITISANASQNEQSCIGPNNLTRQLVSEPCIEKLITDMLRGGNPLTVGVGTIIEVIRKNNSDYDPEVSSDPNATPTSNDPIYLGTLLRYFAKHVPDFMALILSPTHTVASGDSTITIKRKELAVAFGSKIEPLGFDRFKTCELMAELLHCSNMSLLNEKGSEAYIKERDAERDRLKAAGALTSSRPPASAVTDFSEGVDDFTNGNSTLEPDSPDEIRKLEVANNADDDGFEDVGTSADLAEDIKDDFDERSSFELESKPAQIPEALKANKPRLDLDEDFVDEPLTSPRLEALDEKDEDLLEDLGAPGVLDNEYNQKAENEPEPPSPTSALLSKVDDLSFENSVDSPTEGTPVAEEPAESTSSNTEPSPHNPSPEAPPLPRRNQLPEPNLQENTEPGALSPHPDDKPAPLFAARTDTSSSGQLHPIEKSAQDLETRNSEDTVDTTLAQEGDSDRSALLTTAQQPFYPDIETETDGQPIVGDYLKMMFVQHQVVPTILVPLL